MRKSLLLAPIFALSFSTVSYADYEADRIACQIPNFSASPDSGDIFIDRAYQMANELMKKWDTKGTGLKASDYILSKPKEGFEGSGIGGFNTLNGESILQVDTTDAGRNKQHVIIQMQCDVARKTLRILSAMIIRADLVLNLNASYDKNGNQYPASFGFRGSQSK